MLSAEKKDMKLALMSVVIVILLVLAVSALRTHTEGSRHQKNVDRKVELLYEYVPSSWECVSADGGYEIMSGLYRYEFVFMINGISGHVVYEYASAEDLTAETVSRLTRVEENGFEKDPRKD